MTPLRHSKAASSQLAGFWALMSFLWQKAQLIQKKKKKSGALCIKAWVGKRRPQGKARRGASESFDDLPGTSRPNYFFICRLLCFIWSRGGICSSRSSGGPLLCSVVRMILNSCSSCLHSPNARLAGVYHYPQKGFLLLVIGIEPKALFVTGKLTIIDC